MSAREIPSPPPLIFEGAARIPVHLRFEVAIDSVDTTTSPPDTALGSRARRVLLATIGVVLVGLGALGAVVPVLPTVIFLLGASWCFARSCPWLEDKLLNSRIFRPIQPWLRGRISRRAKAGSLTVMWIAIAVSVALLALREAPRYGLAVGVVALGLVGTWFIVRHGPGRGESPDAA